MDDPDCDSQALEYTYRQFDMINALISGWRKIYRKNLRPYLQTRTKSRILDIGFGGGDIPITLSEWAKEDRLDLSITAIDPDKRALEYVKKVQTSGNIEFLQCNSSELLSSGKQYDFVISNHLLHHLSEGQLREILSDAKQLSRYGIIFNDLRRSDLGYLLFNVFSRPVFRSSFITQDGLTSIKRSYTAEELRQTVPSGWHVQKYFPFRLLLTYFHA